MVLSDSAHSARDKLIILPAEIYYKYLLVIHKNSLAYNAFKSEHSAHSFIIYLSKYPVSTCMLYEG